jgi:predicted RNA-binding Zn-ribbon protein involved in translation (DUF1610 family)
MEGLILVAIFSFFGLCVVALGILLYSRAVASRKAHVCPQCGERITVELMDATRCNACGAPLGGSR